MDEVPEYLACLRELFPQFYAMVFLGFATGLRVVTPPLRRTGPTPTSCGMTNVF